MYRQSVGTGTTLRRQSPTAHEPERIKCHASFRSQFRGPWRPRPCGQLPPRHRIAAQSSMIDITAPADIIAGLPPKQTGPAAWLGPEVSQSREWIIELSGSDVAEVEAATAHFLSQPGEPTSRLAHVTPEEFPLPTLAPRLKDLQRELIHGRGFALLRRLPVEQMSRLQAATAFCGLGCYLGASRSQNAKGHVLGHVYDMGLSSTDPAVRIYQTAERQTFHTDSCDVVGLLCLREAMQGGDSLLVSALSIFNAMRQRAPHLLARLLQPMPHDRRGEVPQGQLPFFDIPVFSWYQDQISVFYQRQYFDSAQRFPEARRLTPDDVTALDLFDSLANDPQLHFAMRLAPGDVQFVHNHNLLHDRTAFTDWPQPDHKRHLLRLWLAVPGARELPPAFAARYGSLAVGDRGGIVVPGTRMHVPLDPA